MTATSFSLTQDEYLEMMVYTSNQFAMARKEWMASDEWTKKGGNPFELEILTTMVVYARQAVRYCKDAGFKPENILHLEIACLKNYGSKA